MNVRKGKDSRDSAAMTSIVQMKVLGVCLGNNRYRIPMQGIAGEQNDVGHGVLQFEVGCLGRCAAELVRGVACGVPIVFSYIVRVIYFTIETRCIPVRRTCLL